MSPTKSTIAWPNGKVYFFEDTNYHRYDFLSGNKEATSPITPIWRGLRNTAPDSAVYWGFGKVYFFYGDEYVRYDIGNDEVEAYYLPPNPPRKIVEAWNGWPSDWNKIDAAVNWCSGKIYFFRGSEYLRYDISLDRVDPTYPKPIAGNWPGVPNNLDAVLYQGGEKAYFFKDNTYYRYDLTIDNVDHSGPIGTLKLDPVPPGMMTPSRDLTQKDAHLITGYLVENNKLTLSPPYAGHWQSTITTPSLGKRVVVKPAQINGVDFFYSTGTSPLIDNLDQRMLVCLYRLTRWLNAWEPNVTVIRHLGIGHGSGPENDCHNQGRALDFSGLEGTSLGVAFNRKILRDWGIKPVVSGSPLRLDPAADQLAHDLFLTAFRFGTFECECNGIGPGNKWPPKEIGDVGGFVIHPDYIDSPGESLRAAHQDHIHMQIGPTLS